VNVNVVHVVDTRMLLLVYEYWRWRDFDNELLDGGEDDDDAHVNVNVNVDADAYYEDVLEDEHAARIDHVELVYEHEYDHEDESAREQHTMRAVMDAAMHDDVLHVVHVCHESRVFDGLCAWW